MHAIVIRDKELQEKTKDILEKGRRIIVYGRLNYMQATDDKGAKCRLSSIIANKIMGIDRFDSY